NARGLARDGGPVIVATTSRASLLAREILERQGVEVCVADGPGERVDLKAVLETLGRRGVMSLLVEGGGIVHGAFVDAGLVDKVLAFVAPLLVGGPGPRPMGGAGVATMARASRLTRPVVRQMVQDVVVGGYLVPL